MIFVDLNTTHNLLVPWIYLVYNPDFNLVRHTLFIMWATLSLAALAPKALPSGFSAAALTSKQRSVEGLNYGLSFHEVGLRWLLSALDKSLGDQHS
jgi:hypothetical protein